MYALYLTGLYFVFQFPSFDTEEFYDVVSVRDGLSSDSDLITSLSGKITPDTVISTTNYLFVQFRTDHSVERAGFTASWKAGESDTVIWPTSDWQET